MASGQRKLAVARQRLQADDAGHAVGRLDGDRLGVGARGDGHAGAGVHGGADRVVAHRVGGAASPVVHENAVVRPQAAAPHHLPRPRVARLAEEGQRVAAGRAVEDEAAARGQEIDHAREEIAPHRGDDHVDERAAVAVAHDLDQLAAGAQPARPSGALARHRHERAGQRGILAVHVGQAAPRENQAALLLRRHQTGDPRAAQRRAGHRVEPGAARGALDEHALVVVHARHVVERLVDRLQIEHVRRRLRQREALGVREQLRGLAADELGERPVGRLVALDAEVGVHRIGARTRREQVGASGIEHAELTDLEAALAGGLASERGHQHHRAATRHVQVAIVEIEHRDRHAAGREDRVVREPGVEDIAESLVGTGQPHRHRHATQRGPRLAVRRSSPAVLHHRPHVLARGQRIEAGTKRCADGQRALVGAEPAGIDLVERALARIHVVHTFSRLPILVSLSFEIMADVCFVDRTVLPAGYDNPGG